MKLKQIICLIVVLLMFGSCKKFQTWKELNEQWLNDKTNNLTNWQKQQRINNLETDNEVLEVEILPNGILIEKFHTGYGPIPKSEVDPILNKCSAIRITFQGWLIDNTLFQHNTEGAYYLCDMIDGFKEVLSRMPQGSHWKFYIPSDLGYGEDGLTDSNGNFQVPPYSTLIFDVDLIDVINY